MVQALYSSLSARVRTGSTLSSPFHLHRGKRQGCPLSPALFALAIELMAILLHSSEAVCRISIGPVQERISLYDNNTLLYLRNNTDSLGAALSIIDTFGQYSGICINWGKLVMPHCQPIPRYSKFLNLSTWVS